VALALKEGQERLAHLTTRLQQQQQQQTYSASKAEGGRKGKTVRDCCCCQLQETARTSKHMLDAYARSLFCCSDS
jgi:hypothetical protein